MPEDALVRDDIGDSVIGEKYDSASLGPGEFEPCDECVCKESTGCCGSVPGANLGGTMRPFGIPGGPLSPVPERERRLADDAFQRLVPAEEG